MQYYPKSSIAIFLTAFWAIVIFHFSSAIAQTEDNVITIGELSSYDRFPAFNTPYRNGWQMALEEINKAGGVSKKQLKVISVDDGSNAGDAKRAAESLVVENNVTMLFGTFLSRTALAVSEYANQQQVAFLAVQPITDRLTIQQANDYTYRLRPNVYMQTASLIHAIKDMKLKRWAIVAPDYEFGQSAANTFKQLIKENIPSAEIIVELYTDLGNIDTDLVIQTLEQAKPDAIFNSVFGGDLVKLVKAGNEIGIFEDKQVISLLTGEPEWLDLLGNDAPKGWKVTGYPQNQIEDAQHRQFIANYTKKYSEAPTYGSFMGYTALFVIKQAIEDAGTTDRKRLAAAFDGLEIDTLVGEISFRDIDNQSTLGTWIGDLAIDNGNAVMTNWSYVNGSDFLPPERHVLSQRAQ